MTADVRCGLCGTIGPPRVAGLTEKFFIVMLLLCGIVPGLLAMILVNQQYPCCRACGSKMLLPLDSPRAQLWDREVGGGDVTELGEDDQGT